MVGPTWKIIMVGLRLKQTKNMMNDDIEYPAFTISHSDGTTQNLNRKEVMELIETPPNSVRDLVLAAELKRLINVHDVLVKECKEKNNTREVSFKFVFSDDTKETV